MRRMARGCHSLQSMLQPEPLLPSQVLPQLAGRPFLAGSSAPSCPPHILALGEDDVDTYRLVGRGREEHLHSCLADLVNCQLDKKGALLIRGLAGSITSNQDFSRLTGCLGERFGYKAGFASREEKPGAPGVMAAADDPPEVTIEPHLEMSYNQDMPGRIIFYCHKAPGVGEGGQTPVCDMRRVYTTLESQARELGGMIENGVRYYRTLASRDSEEGSLYSWQKTFPSSSPAEVEEQLAGLGYKTEWTDQGALRYSYLMSAARPHPRTGQMVWSNQSSVSHGSYYLHLPSPTFKDARLAPSHTGHADGGEFESHQLALIRRVQWECSRAHSWQAGDLLVLDNRAVGHGRMGFLPRAERSIVVAITH